MTKKKRSSSKRTPRKPAAPRAPKPAPKRSLTIYHVNAFTARPFHGNPAAVVLVDRAWPDDDTMHNIAIETNQPMTAFVLVGKGKKLGLRWFNATKEFDLCGHATLAAAHVLGTHERAKSPMTFSTAGGEITVLRDKDLLVLTLPARPPVRVRITNDLCAALGREPAEVHVAGDMLAAVFDNKRAVHELEPDLARLAKLDATGIIVTAPAAGHDFVSRYFAPKHGIGEDHATGSSHCVLVPYWAKRLKKNHLTSHQVSHRSGEMWCELRGDRVLLGGHAVTIGKGTISA